MLNWLAVKIAGLAGTGLAAGALTAHPAAAFVILNPACHAGPYIQAQIPPSPSINGICFTPGSPVTVYFVQSSSWSTETTCASATGTIFEPIIDVSPSQQDTIFAVETSNGATSNVIDFPSQ